MFAGTDAVHRDVCFVESPLFVRTSIHKFEERPVTDRCFRDRCNPLLVDQRYASGFWITNMQVLEMRLIRSTYQVYHGSGN